MKVNMKGMTIIIVRWVASCGGGCKRCKTIMVAQYMHGHAPIIRKDGASNGNNPNRLKSVVGSGADIS
jgi:hypothetical protein